jgi:RNA polymerase-binding transcription factor DksA
MFAASFLNSRVQRSDAMTQFDIEARARLLKRAALLRAARESSKEDPGCALAEELREIEAALSRIDAGNYGYCERCGRALGHQRLRAVPAARYCIDCTAGAEAAARE